MHRGTTNSFYHTHYTKMKQIFCSTNFNEKNWFSRYEVAVEIKVSHKVKRTAHNQNSQF